jgi:hypothetical protein
MTRRIRDRERLKRETEDSKRVLEQARRRPERSGRGAPPWPMRGKREAPGNEHPAKH